MTISKKCKHIIENRLRGIQCSLEKIDSARLVYLQQELQHEYDEIHVREGIHWYQKDTDDWIKLGDRNITFFIPRR